MHESPSVQGKRRLEDQRSRHSKQQGCDPVVISAEEYVIYKYSGKNRDHNTRYHKEESKCNKGVDCAVLAFQSLPDEGAHGFTFVALFKIICESKSQHYAGKAVIYVLYCQFAPAHRRVVDVACVAFAAFPYYEVIEVPVYDARNRQLKQAVKILAVAMDLEAEFLTCPHDILHVAAVTGNSCLYTELLKRYAFAEIPQHHSKGGRSAFGGLHLIYCWGFDIRFAH